MMPHDFLELFSRVFLRFVGTVETVYVLSGVRNAHEDAEFYEDS